MSRRSVEPPWGTSVLLLGLGLLVAGGVLLLVTAGAPLATSPEAMLGSSATLAGGAVAVVGALAARRRIAGHGATLAAAAAGVGAVAVAELARWTAVHWSRWQGTEEPPGPVTGALAGAQATIAVAVLAVVAAAGVVAVRALRAGAAAPPPPLAGAAAPLRRIARALIARAVIALVGLALLAEPFGDGPFGDRRIDVTIALVTGFGLCVSHAILLDGLVGLAAVADRKVRRFAVAATALLAWAFVLEVLIAVITYRNAQAPYFVDPAVWREGAGLGVVAAVAATGSALLLAAAAHAIARSLAGVDDGPVVAGAAIAVCGVLVLVTVTPPSGAYQQDPGAGVAIAVHVASTLALVAPLRRLARRVADRRAPPPATVSP